MEIIVKFFLHDEKSHLLHLWKIADENDLLAHSLAKLSDDVRVDSDNVPNTMETSKINKLKDQKADEKFKKDVSEAFMQLSRSATLKEHREASKNLRSLKSDLRKCNDEEEKEDIKEDIADSEQIVQKLKEELGL